VPTRAEDALPPCPDDGQSVLSLQQEQRPDGTVVLLLCGAVDICTAPRLADALGELAGRRVEVDLRDVDLLGAAGLGVIAGASQRLRQAGGDLRLARPRPLAARCLTLTRLDGLLAVEGPPLPRQAYRP